MKGTGNDPHRNTPRAAASIITNANTSITIAFAHAIQHHTAPALQHNPLYHSLFLCIRGLPWISISSHLSMPAIPISPTRSHTLVPS